MAWRCRFLTARAPDTPVDSTQVSTKVIVRLRKLHQCKRAQNATNVHGESLQRVKAQGDVLDTVTGAKLDKATDVNTYVRCRRPVVLESISRCRGWFLFRS